MTIKSSGILTMQDIATELGISVTGLSLNDSRVRTLAGKASGAISFSDLYSKSASSLVAFAGTLDCENGAASTAGVTTNLYFNTDGSITVDYSGSYTVSTSTVGTAYYNPITAGIGSSYWIKATLVSGTTPKSGTMDTWLQLSSVRSWGNFTGTGSVSSTVQSTVQFDIAASSGGTILKTGNVLIKTVRTGTA